MSTRSRSDIGTDTSRINTIQTTNSGRSNAADVDPSTHAAARSHSIGAMSAAHSRERERSTDTGSRVVALGLRQFGCCRTRHVDDRSQGFGDRARSPAVMIAPHDVPGEDGDDPHPTWATEVASISGTLAPWAKKTTPSHRNGHASRGRCGRSKRLALPASCTVRCRWRNRPPPVVP